jgi:hypothetical protein
MSVSSGRPEAAETRSLYGSDRRLLSPAARVLADRGLLKWVIAITAASGALLEVIDTSIVNVALPDIRGNLGATLSEAGWVSTGYACANVGRDRRYPRPGIQGPDRQPGSGERRGIRAPSSRQCHWKFHQGGAARARQGGLSPGRDGRSIRPDPPRPVGGGGGEGTIAGVGRVRWARRRSASARRWLQARSEAKG